MPKISAPTLPEHRAATMDRLLDAFAELLFQKGYSDVSLGEVAARAGIARTGLYTYFSDGESLLFAWTEREVQRTMEALSEDIDRAKSASAKLVVFVRHQLSQFLTKHLPPGREVMHFLGPDTYRRFMDHIKPLEVMLSNIIEEGTAAGEFAKLPRESTVSLIMACIGAERGSLAIGVHEVTDATQRVTDFVLRALAPNLDRPKRRKAALGIQGGRGS